MKTTQRLTNRKKQSNGRGGGGTILGVLSCQKKEKKIRTKKETQTEKEGQQTILEACNTVHF